MKHAASVRPEPGSNSPLSESLWSTFLRMFIDSFISLAFASRFVVLTLLFELTSFLIKVTLILVFSYSVFNVQSREVDIPWFETVISNQVLLRLLFIFAFNFGFIFVSSLVNTLLRFHHWGLYCLPLQSLAQPRFPTLCTLGGFLTDIFYPITSILFVNMIFWFVFTIRYIVYW